MNELIRPGNQTGGPGFEMAAYYARTCSSIQEAGRPFASNSTVSSRSILDAYTNYTFEAENLAEPTGASDLIVCDSMPHDGFDLVASAREEMLHEGLLPISPSDANQELLLSKRALSPRPPRECAICVNCCGRR